MIGIFLSTICLLHTTTVQCKEKNELKNVRQSIEDKHKFWRMSTSHPLAKELGRNPGILLGKIDDFDITRFHGGLPENPKIKHSIETFFRIRKTCQSGQCSIRMETVISQPGRCIRLGDNIPACQSEEYLAVNYDECN